LDTYGHTRIVLEAEAVLGVLALCAAGKVELVSSEALEYETEQNPLQGLQVKVVSPVDLIKELG
jgi:hypothetical protein